MEPRSAGLSLTVAVLLAIAPVHAFAAEDIQLSVELDGKPILTGKKKAKNFSRQPVVWRDFNDVPLTPVDGFRVPSAQPRLMESTLKGKILVRLSAGALRAEVAGTELQLSRRFPGQDQWLVDSKWIDANTPVGRSAPVALVASLMGQAGGLPSLWQVGWTVETMVKPLPWAGPRKRVRSGAITAFEAFVAFAAFAALGALGALLGLVSLLVARRSGGKAWVRGTAVLAVLLSGVGLLALVFRSVFIYPWIPLVLVAVDSGIGFVAGVAAMVLAFRKRSIAEAAGAAVRPRER
jgi:hypothetical protein